MKNLFLDRIFSASSWVWEYSSSKTYFSDNSTSLLIVKNEFSLEPKGSRTGKIIFPFFELIVNPSIKSKFPSNWGSLNELSLSKPNNLINGLSLVNIPSFLIE